MARLRFQGDNEPLANVIPISALDTWASQLSQVHDKHLTNLQNIDWSAIGGATVTSRGRSTFATMAASVLGLGRFTNAATSGTPNRTVVVVNSNPDTISTIDDNGAITPVSLPIALTPGTAMKWTSFGTPKNIIMGCNGVDAPIKIVRDALGAATKVGIVAPSGAPTVALVASTGNLSGLYQYRYTYQSAIHESSPSPVSTLLTTTTTQQQVNVTVTASADSQVTGINIYRIGGTLPVWSFVALVSNTNQTYQDNIADALLGAPLGFFRDPPPSTVQGWVEHKQRIFGFVGAQLLFSNYQEPEGWDPLNQFPIGSTSPIRALGTTGSVLVVFKDQQVWGVLGSTIADFIPVKIFHKGIIAPESAVSAEGLVIWLADDGVRYTDGQDIGYLGEPHSHKPFGIQTSAASTYDIPRHGHEIWGKIRNLTLAQQRTGVGVFAGNRYLLSFPGQFTVAYEFISGNWEIYPWTFDKAASAYDDLGLGQFIMTDGAASTFLRAWPGSYNDLGNPISWFIEKANITGMFLTRASPFRYRLDVSVMGMKRYREVEIVAPRQAGVVVTLTVTMDGDTVNKQYVKSVDLSNGPVRIGLPANMVGSLLTMRLEGSHSQAVEIHGLVGWGYIERSYGRN